MSLPKIIVIVGPTASGKTEFAIDIAEKIGGEIISADSLQVYKEFSICTSKPSKNQLLRVKHHLIGHVSVLNEYNVYSFVKEAKNKINEIIFNNKKIPIIVGGTGLYIDALTNNFQFESSKCENKNFEFHLDENPYEILQKIDPLSAKNINKNDTRRINHAINFFNKYGFSIYNQKINTEKSKKEYEILKLGLNFKNRNLLYTRINNRVDNMLKDGLLEEIDFVRKLKISKTASAAIGFKELLPYFNGESTLYEAIEKIKRQTRRYAKRQITWFKRCRNTTWIFQDEFDYTILDILK